METMWPFVRNKRSAPIWIHGALVIGYVEAALGIGEATRRLVKSLEGKDFKLGLYPYNVDVETRFIKYFMPELYDKINIYALNIIEMAVDQVPAMFEALGNSRKMGSYNVLRTYWELPVAPLEWSAALEHIDEIWVPSRFVEESFRKIFDGRITLVPPSVDVDDDVAVHSRQHFGMDENRFYFLFSFDYFSMPERKNPMAVLRCFNEAFPSMDTNVGLVLKSVGAPDHYPDLKRYFYDAASNDPRIVILDRQIDHSEMRSLVKQIDCYVSLHRSEGFGLGMAEAMATGKIVIATDFSGSTDFLSTSTGFPIGYENVSLKEGDYPYWEGQSWAEPNKSAAVQAMFQVVENREEAEARAKRAKAFVRSRYSHQRAGRIAARRITEILSFIK